MRFIVSCVLCAFVPSVALACGMPARFAMAEVRLAEVIEAIDEAPEEVAPEEVAPVVVTPAPEPPPTEPEAPAAVPPEVVQG